MKLYEKFGDKGFHTSIITTFGVDFDAYEAIALSRLRGAGSRNNILIVDQRMLSHALGGASLPPQFAGRAYSVSGASANGVFHPKVVLQLGRRKGRLIVGSANTTAAGLAGNMELVGLVECDETAGPEQSLIASAYNYVERVLDKDNRAVAQQLSWMRVRVPWLNAADVANGPIELSDGAPAAFLATNDRLGIMQRYVKAIGGDTIQRLIVLSPYWDTDLGAISKLTQALGPSENIVLIDKDRALFPVKAMSGLSNLHLIDLGDFSEGRFVHAKLIIAQSKSADHVLFGSANCTSAALGREGYVGSNEEACLYRRLSRGAVCEALVLNNLVDTGTSLTAEEIPPFKMDDEIGLSELEASYPGKFECLFDTLIWQPAQRIDQDSVKIELFGEHEEPISCSLQRLARSTEQEHHYTIMGAMKRPRFARVRFAENGTSSLAIVSLVDGLRAEVREARGWAAERAANQLEDETEEWLWLLEVFDELESAQEKDANEISSIAKPGKTAPEMEDHFEVLSYQHFVAGCRLRSETTGLGRNSLSGTELSLVRSFLNRVLALQFNPETEVSTEEDEDAIRKSLEMGDEVSDADDALERGETFDEQKKQLSSEQLEKEEVFKKAAKRKQNRDQILKAVNAFVKRMNDRARVKQLSTIDLLRLRAMLTIIAAAAIPESKHGAKKVTSLQVLPASGGEPTWPRLQGKVLFSLFGGKKPPIQFLKIENIFDQIPDDVLECWASCFWIVQACHLATSKRPIFGLDSLTEHVYALTGLKSNELIDERIIHVMKRMGERFAGRLGLDPTSIVNAHLEYVSGQDQNISLASS
jgi:hypothetical protein